MNKTSREDTSYGELLSPPAFEARINTALKSARAGTPPLRLILFGFGGLDLLVGDLGMEATHTALNEVKARLAALLSSGVVAAHLFADRFAVLFQGEGPQEEITRQLMAALRPPVNSEGEEASLQPRFGVASGENASTAQDLLRRATAALQRAESTGGGTPTLYQTSQMPLHAADPSLSKDIMTALEEGQIIPWFQPVWRLSDGAMIGMEALARWQHPTRGIIPPTTFIPLARRAGILAKLDASIRFQSLAWLSKVRSNYQSTEEMTIAVNVADADLADPGLLEAILAELNEHGLPPESLHLELSERATTAQSPEIQNRIHQIAAAGLRWHLDDFGTGHSNIQRLRGLPFSAVKLDRSMIRGLGRDPHSEHLLKPMISLARVLDLEVIAEGVERGEQLQTLTRLSCDMAQGHHLSPPRPAAAIEELLTPAAGPSPQAARGSAQAVARSSQPLR